MCSIEDKKVLIDKYLDYILEANKSINLTRIVDKESAQVLHIEDSLIPLEDVNSAPNGLYGDLGTGGGFPGVPMAIMSGRNAVLIDSVKKKVAVVASGVDELALNDQISTYAGRIEELSVQKPASFAVLTARAVTKLSSLVELASPLLCKGGLLVCYKAQTENDEINASLKTAEKVGMKLIRDYSMTLSDGETKRRIFVFEKIAKSSVKLPRKIGAAQNNPLF